MVIEIRTEFKFSFRIDQKENLLMSIEEGGESKEN